jgi:hypothetical protein
MKRKIKIFTVGLILITGIALALDEEPLVLGRLGEEGELVFPTQAEEGPDGDIYVYDAVDAFIKVYSPEGKFLRKFGGEGQGPGEIQRAGGVRFGFLPTGELYFTEFIGGHRWITIMKKSGELQKTIDIEIPEVFGVIGSHPLEDGNYLLQVSYSFIAENKGDYFFYHTPHELIRVDAAGQIISRIKRVAYITRISYSDNGADAPVPFTPVFSWIPFGQNRVLFSDGLNKKWNVFDYDGKLVEEIETPLPEPARVTKKDLDEWREGWKEIVNKDWYRRFGTVVDKYTKSIYDIRPNLGSLSLTPEGNILASGAAGYGAEYVNYWLLDRKGKIQTRGRTAAASVHITPSFVFYTTRDEEDNWQLYALRRKGSEAQDLKRILK